MSTRSIRNHHNTQNKESEATVYLYGDIGGFFGVDHEEFIKDLNKINADVIHLRVDSEGGDVFAARAIKTAIMQHKAKIIAHIDGLAASAASFLIMGADEIEMVDGGFFMIHNATSILDILGYFNIDDLQGLVDEIGKEIELHSKINESIATDYAKRTGYTKSLDEFLSLMSKETWWTAEEALKNKVIDRVYDGQPLEASYDLSVFAKVPEDLKLRNKKESKRAIEKALRDVGLSNKKAKSILAEGLKDDRRDDDPVKVNPVAPIQQDVGSAKQKRDRVADLLIRAELMAPSTGA